MPKVKSKYFLMGANILAFVCYFLILTVMVPQFRMSYIVSSVFSLVAVGVQLSAIMLIITEPPINEYFYRIPAIYTGTIYIIIQFITGFILSLIDLSIKPVLIIEFAILAICGSIECYMIYAGLHAKDLNEKVTQSISNMRKLTAEAKAIIDIAPDYEWRRLAKTVSDEIQYANPVSIDNTAFIEVEIHKELENLRNAVACKSKDSYEASYNRIKQLLSERNVQTQS